MKVLDEPLLLPCAGETLVGVLSVPDIPRDTGVVIVVGGPQYRAGSHRQFVLLARRLAAEGFPVLRFDYRGMGDSTGKLLDFDAIHDDVRAAIDGLQRPVPSVERVVLWGLCAGASASLLYAGASRDSRLHGLCLLNPWLRTEASQAVTRVKHYYGPRVLQVQFWVKLLTGKVALSAFIDLLRSIRLSLPRSRQERALVSAKLERSYQHRMAEACADFGGSILLLLSGKDYTAKEFLELTRSDRTWAHALRHPRLQRHTLPQANHTFSDPGCAAQAEDLTAAWLLRLAGPTFKPNAKIHRRPSNETVTAHGAN